MKVRILFAVATVLTVALLMSRAQEPKNVEAERYISESEKHWAEAIVSGDAAFLDRILADDYWGLQPDGTFHDKSKEIAETRKTHGEYVSNQVTEVKVRFFGDTAVAQGSETWEMRSGEPRRGRYVWTDTWVKRRGNWQVVASADVLVPEGAK